MSLFRWDGVIVYGIHCDGVIVYGIHCDGVIVFFPLRCHCIFCTAILLHFFHCDVIVLIMRLGVIYFMGWPGGGWFISPEYSAYISENTIIYIIIY